MISVQFPFALERNGNSEGVQVFRINNQYGQHGKAGDQNKIIQGREVGSALTAFIKGKKLSVTCVRILHDRI